MRDDMDNQTPMDQLIDAQEGTDNGAILANADGFATDTPTLTDAETSAEAPTQDMEETAETVDEAPIAIDEDTMAAAPDEDTEEMAEDVEAAAESMDEIPAEEVDTLPADEPPPAEEWIEETALPADEPTEAQPEEVVEDVAEPTAALMDRADEATPVEEITEEIAEDVPFETADEVPDGEATEPAEEVAEALSAEETITPIEETVPAIEAMETLPDNETDAAQPEEQIWADAASVVDRSVRDSAPLDDEGDETASPLDEGILSPVVDEVPEDEVAGASTEAVAHDEEEDTAENEYGDAVAEEAAPAYLQEDDDVLPLPPEVDMGEVDRPAVDAATPAPPDPAEADQTYVAALQTNYDDATQVQSYYEEDTAEGDMAAQLQQRLDAEGNGASVTDAAPPAPLDEEAIAALLPTRDAAYVAALHTAFPAATAAAPFEGNIPDGSMPYTVGLRRLLDRADTLAAAPADAPVDTSPTDDDSAALATAVVEDTAAASGDIRLGRVIKPVNNARSLRRIIIPAAWGLFLSALFLLFALAGSWLAKMDFATAGGISLNPFAAIAAVDIVGVMMAGGLDIPFILANAVPLVTVLVYYLALLSALLTTIFTLLRAFVVSFKSDYYAKRAAFSRQYRAVARSYTFAMYPVLLSLLWGQPLTLLGGCVLGVGVAVYLYYVWVYARFHNIYEETERLDGANFVAEGARKTLVLAGFGLAAYFFTRGWLQQFFTSAYSVTHNVTDAGLLGMVAYYLRFAWPLWMTLMCLLVYKQLRRTIRAYAGRFAVPDRRKTDRIADTEDNMAYKLSSSVGRMVLLLAFTAGLDCLQTYALYGLSWQGLIVRLLSVWLIPIAAELACAMLLSSGIAKQIGVRKHKKRKKRRNKRAQRLAASAQEHPATLEEEAAPAEAATEESGTGIDTDASYAKRR